MVVGQSMDQDEQAMLCSEAHKLGIPSVVMDPWGRSSDDCELHVNPLDGPESFLEALASLLKRKHRRRLTEAHC